jgi:ureidoglycolate lyase
VLVVHPRPLSAAAFAPFGEVIEHAGSDPRCMIASAFETDGLPPEHLLWVYQLPEPCSLPLRVTTMERHPHSSQLFSPLSCSGFLVIACPSRENGEPDVDGLAAFFARGDQGIVYRRNLWHHAMVALGGAAEFVVSLAKGCTDDTVTVSIDHQVTVAAISRNSP